jgi:hypothetical protein
MEQALKELEEIREWVRSQNQEQLSYKVHIAPHTLRMFSNKRVFCPSFKIIRTLQLFMNNGAES